MMSYIIKTQNKSQTGCNPGGSPLTGNPTVAEKEIIECNCLYFNISKLHI